MKIRDELQTEATQTIIDNNHTGAVLIAPRVGKTKIVIDSLKGKEGWKIVVTSPSMTIRENWHLEADKWGLGFKLTSICHASLIKLQDELDLLIVDEAQELSVKQILTIKNRKPKRILFVSGTVHWGSMQVLTYHLGYKVIYEYGLEDAIRDKIISDFEVIVVNCALNNSDKTILTGPKTNQFYTTEKANYDHLTRMVEKYKVGAKMDGSYQRNLKFFSNERANFIYSAASKVNAARELIWGLEERVLIFTTRTEIADKLSPYAFHSKIDKENLEKFMNEEVDKLSVAKMLSMGITINNLKLAVIHQLQSNSEISIQKILRTCNIETDLERTAKIWIFQYEGTVDEDWVKDALQEVPANKIRFTDWTKFKKKIG